VTPWWRANQKPGERDFTYFFSRVNKSALRTAILDKLKQEFDLQTRAAHLARDEATSEESRAENKYDTHSQEAAYLAEGQARLANELEISLAQYATLPLPDFTPDAAIEIGALVELHARGTSAWYFLGPRNGGLELRVDDRDILLLTPQAPLGRQLLGKRKGNTVESSGRANAVTYRIVTVE